REGVHRPQGRGDRDGIGDRRVLQGATRGVQGAQGGGVRAGPAKIVGGQGAPKGVAREGAGGVAHEGVGLPSGRAPLVFEANRGRYAPDSGVSSPCPSGSGATPPIHSQERRAAIGGRRSWRPWHSFPSSLQPCLERRRRSAQGSIAQWATSNLIGNSDPSNEASATPHPPATPPDPPQGLTATAGDGTVDLAWSAPGSDGGSPVTNYKVYRGTSQNGESFLTELGDVLSYSDTGLNNGQTYYYYVTAVNSIGDSGPSNEASATPNAPATPPGAPQSLTATAGDATVVLAWSPPSSDGGAPITNYK